MAAETKTGGRAPTEAVIGGGLAIAVGKPPTPTPDGFEWRQLADLARLETGHTPSRRHPEYWDGDIPWIGIRDATGNHGRTIHSTLQTVTQEGINNSSARVLPKGTVCLSRTASVGYIVVMGAPMATSQDFVNWVCGPELDPRYLKFVLQADRDALLRFASGSTHQTIYFPEVKAFHALLPSIEEQRSIAATLGALDNKIESNSRAAVQLRQLAQFHFESAISTDPGMVPLGELATITKGRSYKSAELQPSKTALVTLKSIDRNGGYKRDGLKPYVGDHKPEQMVLPGELVVAQTDLTQGAEVVGRGVRVPRDPAYETLVASLDLAILRAVGSMPVEYLHGLLTSESFRQHCRSHVTGTTVLHLAKDAVPTWLAPVIPPADQATFAAIARPLLARMDALNQESDAIARLRDELLQELLSGRIRVPEAAT